MSSSARRVAFATEAERGVALGDPTGAHVLLAPGGIVYRRAEADEIEIGWRDVTSLAIDAPVSRSRRPGGLAVLLGAAAGSIGLDWGPGIAPVTVTVEDRDGTIDLECDGFIGHGYWSPHLVAVQGAAHALVEHPGTRDALERPGGVVRDLDEAAGVDPGEVRRRLVRRWGEDCRCG
jgi:hypothetical protein